MGQVFIESALKKQEILINGDGNDKLDFTYIQDLIDGIMLACENKNAINETFNLTYGNARKINELMTVQSVNLTRSLLSKRYLRLVSRPVSRVVF